MLAGGWIKCKLAVKLGKAERWQKPPVLRRDRLHVGDVATIHLLDKHPRCHTHALLSTHTPTHNKPA